MTLLPLGLVALLLAQAAPALKGDPVRPPAPAGLSWEDADWVAETVARVERRLSAGKPASRQTIVVTRATAQLLGEPLPGLEDPAGLSRLSSSASRRTASSREGCSTSTG